MTMDLGSVKKDFSALLSQIQPWTLSHFVMWLDIKVAEYKVFGHMILDNTPNDTPQWLRGKTYLDQYKDPSEPSLSPTQAAPVSPRSSHPPTSIRGSLQMFSTSEPIVSLAASPNNGLYTVSTVNTTVVSPSVSPAYPSIPQTRSHLTSETYIKSAAPIQSPGPEMYSKLPSIAQFPGFPSQETQRIPPISHLSPKNIRQSHIDQSLSLTRPLMLGKDSMTPAEVETQIAVLQSQIAAVNRNLNQSQPPPAGAAETLPQPPSQSRSRKASHELTDINSSYTTPYSKRSRQQSPVGGSSSRSSSETINNVTPARPEMDMLPRYHRMDSGETVSDPSRVQSLQSISEIMRSQQTFPAVPESLRAQSVLTSMDAQRLQAGMEAGDASIQNMAQDMTIAHSNTEREAPPGPPPPPQSGSTISSVNVKVEHSDEDSSGGTIHQSQGESHNEDATPRGVGTGEGEETMDDGSSQSYPVGMFPSPGNSSGNQEDKAAADITTKKMRRKFLESMKNSNPKYYSHQIQQIIPFPEKFPVSNLDYGLKALQMIQTGEITRAGKIQLIDTIFHELIKYTGLYPTPTQKMAVANSIVETFPTLAAKMKASHISPADSWYVILCDKFRNERRGLSSSGTPRVGKIAKMVKQETGQSADSPEEVSEVTPPEESQTEESPQPQPQVVPQRLHNVFSPPPPTQSPSQPQTQPTYSSHSSAGHMTPPAYSHGYEQPQGKCSSRGVKATSDSSDDDEDDQNGEKLLMDNKEKQMYAEQITKSLKKRTPSSSSTDVSDILLDERYAASLLQYYSKHKPFYPAYSDGNKTLYSDMSKQTAYTGYGDPSKLAADVYAADEALAQQFASDKLASQQMAVTVTGQTLAEQQQQHMAAQQQQQQQQLAEQQQQQQQQQPSMGQEMIPAPREENADVSTIVQTVVEAHMDEIIASRSQQEQAEEGSCSEVPPISKIFQKKKPRPAPREQTPEQLQIKQQRFVHKVGITYPGVRVLDEATLECTCGTKVKLGRPRMLHNYTNYHLRRCPVPPGGVPPQTVGYDPGSMHLQGQSSSLYDMSGDSDKQPDSPPPSGSLEMGEKGDASMDMSQAGEIQYAPSVSPADCLSGNLHQIPTSGPEVAQEQTVETMEMPESGHGHLQESMLMSMSRQGLEAGVQEHVLPDLARMGPLEMEQDKQEVIVQTGPGPSGGVVRMEDEPMNLTHS